VIPDEELFGDLLPRCPDVSGPEAIPAEMTEVEIADLFGLSISMVRTKAREGVFVRSRRGRYDVAACIRAYVPRLREMASRAGPGSKSTGATADLNAEKLRLTRAQADKEETRVARERGEFVPAADVTREWSNVLRDVRNALLAVPSRCGASLPHLTATDVATMEKEIRSSLEGLGNAD
jgi:phage terminase Nu1 subunit (DNA packaging protein)